MIKTKKTTINVEKKSSKYESNEEKNEFSQAARWSNNIENDQKMADNAYLFRVYLLHTCVS